MRDRTPTIRAVVRDGAVELRDVDIALRLVGRWKGFYYDPGTDSPTAGT